MLIKRFKNPEQVTGLEIVSENEWMDNFLIKASWWFKKKSIPGSNTLFLFNRYSQAVLPRILFKKKNSEEL